MGKKSLAHFVSFFVYALLHLMSCAPKFCQMKELVKIYTCDRFHHYTICGCEAKYFWIDSAFMKWPLFRFFWPLTFPNIVQSCWHFDQTIKQTQCLKILSKFWILAEMEGTQSLQFSSILELKCTAGKPKILLKHQNFRKNYVLRNIK